MKVDPAVVHAMILDQYGLTVTDARWHSGASGPNPAVYTKDQNNTVQPRLYIKFADTVDTVPPGAVRTWPPKPGPESGQVVLNFDAPTTRRPRRPSATPSAIPPTNDFAAATDLARWRIPRPKLPGMRPEGPGGRPDAGHDVLLLRAGVRCGWQRRGRSRASVSPPAGDHDARAGGRWPFVTPDPTGKSIQTVANVMRWWAASEVSRVNPVTGNRYEDGYTGTRRGQLQEGQRGLGRGTNTISLLAARTKWSGRS